MSDTGKSMKMIVACLMSLALILVSGTAFGCGGGGGSGGGSSSGGSSSGGGNVGGGSGGLSAKKTPELAAAFKSAMPNSQSESGKSFGGSGISKKSFTHVKQVFGGGESGSATGGKGTMGQLGAADEQHLDKLGKAIEMVETNRSGNSRIGTICVVNLPYVVKSGGEGGGTADARQSITSGTAASVKSPDADKALANAQVADIGPDKTPRTVFESRMAAVAAKALQEQGETLDPNETPQQMLERAVQAVAVRNMIPRPDFRASAQ